jgi:type I site-specific restriction endonuclease
VNEAKTRAEHIDPALAAAGWGVVEGSRIRREYPITLGRIEGNDQRGKALSADYGGDMSKSHELHPDINSAALHCSR